MAHRFVMSGVLMCLVLLLPLAARAATSPPLRSLTIQLRDLPNGAQADPARTYTNAQAAARDRVPATMYPSHGRITSYHNSFFRLPIGGLLPTWLERADSEITAYRNGAGAAWYFARQRRITGHDAVSSSPASGTLSNNSGVHRYPYHPAALPRVGAQSSGFSAFWPSDEFSYTTGILLFREGRYVVFLRVVGQQGLFSWKQVMALGRTVDARIRRAGGR